MVDDRSVSATCLYCAGVPFASEPDFLVLHALRIKGFAEPQVIEASTQLDGDEVAKFLEVFETEGLATHRAGRVSGWVLTGDGRAEDERRAAAELDAAGARDVVSDAYRRFVALNPEVLQVCTDWQLREGAEGATVNDHRDHEYDREVIARLAALDAAAQLLCADLATVLERFDDYGPRFSTALARVQQGEKDWFTRPTIDSYHTVWFELHENMLATLGIQRGEDTA